MPALMAPSTKESVVLSGERLFAVHGLDGVSLRQIGAASGNGNNSVVQYHFGSKDQLIQAIFEYRLPRMREYRMLLVAERQPADLRGWVECHILSLLAQAERPGSHYLSFIAMLRRYGRNEAFDRLPQEFRDLTREDLERLRTFLPDIAEPLRSHRIAQGLSFVLHAAADRERARASGQNVLPFAVEATDLLDGTIGFLTAPASPSAVAVLGDADVTSLTWSLFL